ncbi:MAG: hypothetical protein IKQ41_07200 [Clostridia bacterium]|nr:hypothetical protein [Clostridia bacterium]
MDHPNKKGNQKETETGKDEKIQLTDDEVEKVAAGASFGFWDREKRRPK